MTLYEASVSAGPAAPGGSRHEAPSNLIVKVKNGRGRRGALLVERIIILLLQFGRNIVSRVIYFLLAPKANCFVFLNSIQL